MALSACVCEGSAEMLESVSTDSRHYPQERGARFAEDGGRFTGMPRMTLRLRYRTLKTSRAVLGLALGLSQLPAGEHQV
jgi:hypothetical protein